MIDVHWLLTNHKEHVARVNVLEVLIDKADLATSGDGEAELIEEITLAPPPLDGLPRPTTTSSRTESVALNLERYLREDKQQQAIDCIELVKERELLIWYISLYNAAISILNEPEMRLVELYYDMGVSLERISQISLIENGGFVRSISTLRRMLASIERKMSKALSPIAPK